MTGRPGRRKSIGRAQNRFPPSVCMTTPAVPEIDVGWIEQAERPAPLAQPDWLPPPGPLAAPDSPAHGGLIVIELYRHHGLDVELTA